MKSARLFSASALAVLVLSACSSSTPAADIAPTSSSSPSAPSEGWTRIANPPEIREGASFTWAGDRFIYWGGRSPSEKALVSDGYAYDPVADVWSRIPAAPGSGRGNSTPVWSGEEVLFLGGNTNERLEGRTDGVAFNPESNTWRRIPTSPIVLGGAVHVWTGKEIIIWGGGDRGATTNRSGASYDPSKNKWKRIADAPIELTVADGVWMKHWMVVFGSSLNRGNHSDTRYALGAVYSAKNDKWHLMSEGSRLSPQATSLAWYRDGGGGGALVAWDYVGRYQQPEDPWGSGWSKPKHMPIIRGECYPEGAPFDQDRLVFSYYCGQAALFDGSKWRNLSGGPVDEMVSTDSGAEYQLWRFATLAPADDFIGLELEGIVIREAEFDGDSGVCYGCAGYPTSFWVYRAPVEMSANPGIG